MKRKHYLINIQTLAIEACWNDFAEPCAKVYEEHQIIEVSQAALTIIEDSLHENGQTFRGAKEGTYALIGRVQLPPITVNEVHGIYWIYTALPKENRGIWLAQHAIHKYVEVGDRVLVTLINGQQLYANMKLKSFEKKLKEVALLKQRREQRTLFMLRQQIAEHTEGYQLTIK